MEDCGLPALPVGGPVPRAEWTVAARAWESKTADALFTDPKRREAPKAWCPEIIHENLLRADCRARRASVNRILARLCMY